MTTLSFQDAVTLVSAVNNRIDVGQAAVNQGYAELEALDKCIIEAGLDPVEVSVIALGIPVRTRKQRRRPFAAKD